MNTLPPITFVVWLKLKVKLVLWWLWPWRVKPFVGVLGKDKLGVICSLQSVKGGNEGCSQMPYIPSREMSKGITKLAHRGYTPCGVYRVGFCRAAFRGASGLLTNHTIKDKGGVVITTRMRGTIIESLDMDYSYTCKPVTVLYSHKPNTEVAP
jgi:hypothetical protein